MKKRNTLILVLTAMFTALTTVVTMFIRVPNPVTDGYVNIGDCIILIGATLLGSFPGFIIGGLGSCLADVLSGYAHWALPTFIIKGIEGFICGITTYYIFRSKATKPIKLLSVSIVSLLCSIVMMFGYFIANYIMGGIGKATASVIPNTIQAVVSAVIDILFISALIKTKVFNGYLSLSPVINIKKAIHNKTNPNGTKDMEVIVDNNETDIIIDNQQNKSNK